MDINQASLQMHYDLHGKIEVISRKKIETREDLSLAYTPGVAEPCRVIAKDYEQSFKLTRRSNLVAVITDGTAVLGLGGLEVVFTHFCVGYSRFLCFGQPSSHSFIRSPQRTEGKNG